MSQLVLPVVVGVDGTDESLQAVRYGVQEAQRRGCGLRLVHVMPQHTPLSPMLPLVSTESFEQVGFRLVRAATLLANELSDTTLTVESAVRSGPRVGALTEESKSACLVVLGRQSRSRFGRIVAGSTTSGVAGHARSPVVMVPPWWRSDQRYGRVVVGIEQANHDRGALAVAFEAAKARGAELTVLHVWRLMSPYDTLLTRTETDQWQQQLQVSIERELHAWQDVYSGVPVRVEVVHHRAVEALVARSAEVDLVVVGRHGHHALRGAHLGSVTRAVVREASSPVAVAPTDGVKELPETNFLTEHGVSLHI